MSNTVKKRILFTMGCAVLLAILMNNRPINQYIEAVKLQTITANRPAAEKSVAVVQTGENKQDEQLRKQIERWKQEIEKAPINARIDHVWRAVPGYNGLAVDVEASIKKLKGATIPDQRSLVVQEVPPAISLEQLGSHPIYRGNPEKPAVSFMVNVAWGNEYLDPILDTLDKHGVKTTFFLDGSWVKRYPELAKKIADRGHELGNHAYSHPDMANLGPERIRQEIQKTQAVIQQATGIKPDLFAPPSGSFNQTVVDIAKNEFHMKTILWTADTVDWKKPPVYDMLKRVRAKMGNGVLVLMHPTAPSAEGLDTMIQEAKAKGLSPATVSEVISSKRVK